MLTFLMVEPKCECTPTSCTSGSFRISSRNHCGWGARDGVPHYYVQALFWLSLTGRCEQKCTLVLGGTTDELLKTRIPYKPNGGLGTGRQSACESCVRV